MKTIKVSFRVNDEDVTFQVKPYETLLETLRERLDLIGAKEACGLGACGACTVIVDGIPLRSCIDYHGRRTSKGWEPASPSGGLYGERGGSVRLLHVRDDHDGQGPP
jgi:hypothetical protein